MLSAGINRNGTGTVDPVISAPTHEDGSYTDLMEVLPLVSCVISHFEIELIFEHLSNWRMVDHLQVDVVFLRHGHCSGIKMDRGVASREVPVPINVL